MNSYSISICTRDHSHYPYIRCQYRGKSYYVRVNYKLINIDNFDNGKRVKNGVTVWVDVYNKWVNKNEPNYELINRAIARKREEIGKVIYGYHEATDRFPTTDELKKLLGKVVSEVNQGETVAYDIEGIKNAYLERRIKDGLSRKTKESYDLVFGHLEKSGLHLSKIDSSFVYRFTEYLRSIKDAKGNQKIGKGSVVIYLAKLKSISNYLQDAGYSKVDSKAFDHVDTTTEKRYIFYFHPNEIKAIYNLTFIDSREFNAYRMGIARDRFIFQCETALRPSDLINPNWQIVWEKEQPVLLIMPKKTTESTAAIAKIPLSPEAYEIFQKYKGQLPYIEKTSYYKYIREIGRLAGINEQITMVRGRGKRSNGAVVLKWQLIEPRSARSHFACYHLRAKFFTPDEIAVMMGITVSTLRKNYMEVDTGALAESASKSFIKRGALRFVVNESIKSA